MTRLVVLALAVLSAMVLAAPAHAKPKADGNAEVTFVNGVRGFLADVYLDDELILKAFMAERITEPMTLAPGRHRIDLRTTDAPADAEPDITKSFSLEPGDRVTAIAHWTAADKCIVTLFDDEKAVKSAGSGKVIVRHAAQTGAISVAVDDTVVDRRLRPNTQVARPVKARQHTLAIEATTDDFFESSRVPVPEGGARVVYLVGQASEDTLGLLTQTVEELGTNPSGVPTGDSGLAGRSSPAPVTAMAALVFAGLLSLRRRRRRQPAS